MKKKYSNIGIDSIEYVESENTEETFVHLATNVADNMLKKEKIKVEDIGVLIYVTQYSEFLTPSTSFLIHRNLALSKDCFQYDINQGGVGFLSGIQLICSLLLGFRNEKKGLLICADYSERIQDKKAASVALLSRQMDTEIIISNYVVSKWYEYELREHECERSERKVDMYSAIQKEYLLQQDKFKNELRKENIEEEQKVYSSLEDTMMYVPKIICQKQIQGNVMLGTIGAGMSVMQAYCRIK